MAKAPQPPKPVNPSKAKLARQARLDAALRANLRRRKAPEKTSEKAHETLSVADETVIMPIEEGGPKAE